jgi:hypothetical protein
VKRPAVILFCVVMTALFAVPFGSGCAPKGALVLRDSIGDDHGPGSYRYPDHPAFSPGSFDLEAVVLYRDGDDWVAEVLFGARLEKALVFVRQDDRRELFPQAVDIYFRVGIGPGHPESLPGRNVRFAPEDGWHKAIVISSVPHQLRRALESTTEISADVFVPHRVRLSGRRLKARIPASFLGEHLPFTVSVLITGTSFRRSFHVTDRVRGTLAPEGMSMEVTRSAGECRLDDPEGMDCNFWGCDPCGSHPMVIDGLFPAGVQERILSDYDPAGGRQPEIPVIKVENPSGTE